MTGMKDDSTKPRPTLLPMDSITEVLKVLEFGAKKYSKDNWKKVDDAEQRYLDANLRHLMEFANGSENDSESGLSHLAHAVCCGLFQLHFIIERNKEQAEQDKITKALMNEIERSYLNSAVASTVSHKKINDTVTLADIQRVQKSLDEAVVPVDHRQVWPPVSISHPSITVPQWPNDEVVHCTGCVDCTKPE